MIKELDCVVLNVDLPEHRLEKGDVGTVVLIHDAGGYEIEFVTFAGETVAVVSLLPEQIRPIARGDLTHVRPVEAA